MAVRVLLVDDEDLMRQGLRMMLDDGEVIAIVGEASDGAEALRLARGLRPDVILMDIRMPGVDGISALSRLRTGWPESPPVLMLTAFDTPETIMEALQAGAAGFLLKSTSPTALVDAVLAAASDQRVLSPTVLEHVVNQPASRAAVRLDSLSARENEIAELVAEGLSNKEIGKQLFISVPTVKTHIAHIMDKLGVGKRIQIAVAILEAR